jgi:hypothetical protein
MAGTTQPWTMVLYNHLGAQIGGINEAHERTFTFQFNAPQTIQFILDTTNPATKRILEHREEALYVVLLYYNNLVLTTEITGLNLIGSADAKSMAVTCVETMWTRLMPRLVGKTTAGYEVAAATDKLTIVKNLVEALNAEGGGNFATGITPLNTTLGITATYPKVNYKPFQEIMEDLAFTSSGFDFWQVSNILGSPGEYANGVTGVLKYAALKGKNRSVEGEVASSEMAVFEYGEGTRGNVQSYNFTSDYTLLGNDIYVIPSGFPTSTYGAGVHVSNVASEKAFGYRDAVSATNINDAGFAQTLAEDTINFRRLPRQQFTFQPINKNAGGVPEFKPGELAARGIYEVGDIVTGRIKDHGITILNAQVRVYANTITLDDSGAQTETLTLTMGG